jgi:hypothetical protein
MIRMLSEGTRAFAVPAPPESFLQLSQWQYRTADGSAVTSNCTSPQRQLPRSGSSISAPS